MADRFFEQHSISMRQMTRDPFQEDVLTEVHLAHLQEQATTSHH